MSGTEGIDQNGGALKGDISAEAKEAKVELPPADHSTPTIDTKNTMDDTYNMSDTDTSINQKDSPEAESQSALSDLSENQEGKEKVNKSTNENKDSDAKTDQVEAFNQSKELKALLALSKEARLDTNISRKRKVINLRKKGRSESRFSPGRSHKIQYPVTAESELEMELHSAEGQKMDTQEDESFSIVSNLKAVKRKKSVLSDGSGDSITDETSKKNRKSFSSETTMFKPDKDMFCWRCHKDSVNIACETCPRSYHQRCLKQTITDMDHWPCPECVSILKAESTQSRSPAMRGMTLENLCSLLKFAVNRMVQCQGSEPFIHAVNDNEFPEYKKYIIQPMDLTLLGRNIKENLYGSTQAFEADAKWILHNSIVFNSYQSKLTNVAKSIIKICKQEMSEIENCPSCYLNANTKKRTWFVEVCPKPHLLVWAKLRGFPFWPGKAMSCKDGMVDVRFFGAHDRAWVPEKECFLYSPKDPNLFRAKRADIERCVEELEVHVENMKKVYIEFNYPSFKTPLDPDNEVKQLQIFLPRYKSYFNKHRNPKRQSLDKEKTESKETRPTEGTKELQSENKEKMSESLNTGDETMEGYGTDDESVPEIDTELRKTLLKEPQSSAVNEADDDDTQMPTNIEPDASGSEDIVLIRGTIKRISGKLGVKKSDSEPGSKRTSFDDSSPHSVKILRRNSETKSEELPRISDKISKINISEDMEISLGNVDKGHVENISSSNSESSNDFSVEIKKKPVQVDVDNVEFTISPARKLKIADKLIKRLSDGESEADCSNSKVEQAKRNLDKSESKKLVEKEVVQDLPEESVIDPEVSDADPVSSTHNDNEAISLVESQSSKDNAEIEGGTKSALSPKVDGLKELLSEKVTEEKIEKLKDTSSNSPRKKLPETKIDNKVDETKDSGKENANLTNVKETIPNFGKSRIVIKMVRAEEQLLDQLMKKSMEEEKGLEKQKAEGALVVAENSNRENPRDNESGKGAIQDVVSDTEKSKASENKNSPQEQTLLNKTSSPEKPVTKIVRRPSKEKRDGTPVEKETPSKPAKDNHVDQLTSTKGTEEDSSKKNADTNANDKKTTSEIRKEIRRDRDGDNDEAMDSIDDVDLHIDKANIINIIHSSLNDTRTSPTNSTRQDNYMDTEESTPKSKPTTRSNKRKKSIEFDESVIETQNKILKLVSIESIMNKANNNQDENKRKTEDASILKTSLQSKKVAQPASIQNSPASSARNSIHEVSSEEIKSEPESEAESGNVRDLEAKKKYLSALNILEKGEADAQKPKPHEIRTRSKTEEKRERFRVSNESDVVDNMTKIIDDVAVNYSAVNEGETLATKKKPPVLSTAKPDGCEIYVKSFAKIAPESPVANNTAPVLPTKQRARKSFPQPNYTKPVIRPNPPPVVSKEQPSAPVALPTTDAIPRLTPRTPTATSSPIVSTITPTQASKVPVPPLQQIEAMRPTNGYLILQPPQQDNVVFLPPNQTINYSTTIANQVVSVTPCLLSAPTNTQAVRHLTQPQTWAPNQSLTEREFLNVRESQNYIPQGEQAKTGSTVTGSVQSTASNGSRKLVNGLPEPASISSAVETSNSAIPVTLAALNNTERPAETPCVSVSESPPQAVEPAVVADSGDDDELAVLNSMIPENVSRAVSEIIRRPPPKLKPRPPGILSQQFSEGSPSSAGPVTARINSVAHRLGDYFRGMLIETLEDLGKTNNSEATVSNLKLEIETLKHKHSIEVSEIEKNMCTVLKDIQQSIIEDRDRVIEETRAACEAETIKRVEDAKSKQWCANCSKEAQFYCCWNTSYCDYPCQQKHWPNHMNKCTQNVNQPAQITASTGIRPGGQQLILRPANPPPKGGIGRVFTKPLQKVYMNRNVTAPKTMRVQTSAGNLLTMMETTPGNYQLMTSNALVRTGPSLTSIKSTGLLSVPSSGNAAITANSQPKTGPSKQPIRFVCHPTPVTTVLEEDSD